MGEHAAAGEVALEGGAFDRAGPRHVGIIMDGNGRWAAQRGLGRSEGHREGIAAVRRAVAAAPDLGIEYLTLYSFSSENWSRPKSEIDDLFGLMKRFMKRDLAELHRNGVSIRVIGDRAVPDPELVAMIEEAETLTRDNTALKLVVAFNYGARVEIAGAARRLAEKVARGELAASAITPEIFGAHLDTAGLADPDLLIRTSGEVRLSNFLLWQLAYAELVFLDVLWPDFSREHLDQALAIYRARNRRFGGLAAQPTSGAS